MASHGPQFILASCTGIAFTGTFLGVALGTAYIAMPGYLLPAPRGSQPDAKTAPTSSQPATPPDHLARQFLKIYNIGKVVAPTVMILSAASYLYAASQLPTTAVISKQFLYAATACNVAVVPFTALVMMGTIKELTRRANAAEAGVDETVARKDARDGSLESMQTADLFQWWSGLNVMRSMFGVGALACAMIATVV